MNAATVFLVAGLAVFTLAGVAALSAMQLSLPVDGISGHVVLAPACTGLLMVCVSRLLSGHWVLAALLAGMAVFFLWLWWCIYHDGGAEGDAR